MPVDSQLKFPGSADRRRSTVPAPVWDLRARRDFREREFVVPYSGFRSHCEGKRTRLECLKFAKRTVFNRLKVASSIVLECVVGVGFCVRMALTVNWIRLIRLRFRSVCLVVSAQRVIVSVQRSGSGRQEVSRERKNGDCGTNQHGNTRGDERTSKQALYVPAEGYRNRNPASSQNLQTQSVEPRQRRGGFIHLRPGYNETDPEFPFSFAFHGETADDRRIDVFPHGQTRAA